MADDITIELSSEEYGSRAQTIADDAIAEYATEAFGRHHRECPRCTEEVLCPTGAEFRLMMVEANDDTELDGSDVAPAAIVKAWAQLREDAKSAADPEYKRLLLQLMVDMVSWGGEEDGVPDSCVGFWEALTALGGWVEPGEDMGNGRRVFLPGAVVDLLHARIGKINRDVSDELPSDYVRQCEELMAKGQAPLEEARDKGRVVTIQRALGRRLVGSMSFLLGFNEACANEPTDYFINRLSRYFDKVGTQHRDALIAALALDGDEDLDD